MFDATSSNGLCPKANEVVEVNIRCRKWGFKFFCDLEWESVEVARRSNRHPRTLIQPKTWSSYLIQHYTSFLEQWKGGMIDTTN